MNAENMASSEIVTSVDRAAAGLHARAAAGDKLKVIGRYNAVCRDKDGNIKWDEDFDNLVTTPGGNALLDIFFAASGYTAAMFLGLKGAGAAAAGDTQASHAAWQEVGGANAPAYTGNRKTPAWSAASGRSKAMSAGASFVFTSGGTVTGCFMNSGGAATKDDTTGVLYSAGDFATARTVQSGDSLSVTYTGSV